LTTHFRYFIYALTTLQITKKTLKKDTKIGEKKSFRYFYILRYMSSIPSNLKSMVYLEITKMSKENYSTNCNACNELIRKDSYITHILKNHPNYLWEEIMCINVCEDGATDFRTKVYLDSAIQTLREGAPYELGDEVYADFGSKVVYKTSSAAMKHILKDTEKHKKNFMELLNITPDKLATMLKIMGMRPKRILDVIKVKEIEDRTAIALKEAKDEIELYREDAEKWREHIKSEEYIEYQAKIAVINNYLINTRNEKADIQYKLNEANRTLERYKNSYINIEKAGESSASKEAQLMDDYEKLKQKTVTHYKKLEEALEKKVKDKEDEVKNLKKKSKEDIEVLKDDVESYKYEIKTLKKKLQRAKSTKSESDSD